MRQNKSLISEIQNIREELHRLIEKNGINYDPNFINLNKRLDELIVLYFKEK